MIASGGAGLSGDLFEAYSAIELLIHQGYGLTETSPVVCSTRFNQCVPNSVGPAILDVQLKTDDRQQLFVKGPGVMIGYWNDPAGTSERISNGWLATGDIAVELENGHWQIVGRVDDQIALPNGYKLNPIEIEQEWSRSLGLPRVAICLIDKELVALVELPICL